MSYRKGSVVKRIASIRKAGDSVFLKIKGKVAHEFVGASCKNNLLPDQVKLVNLLLRPYGMTYEDIK